MKKFISLLLLTVTVLTVMVVPAFASDSPTVAPEDGANIPANIISVARSSSVKGDKTNFHIYKHNTDGTYLVCYANSPAVYIGGNLIGGNRSNFMENCNYLVLNASGQEVESVIGKNGGMADVPYRLSSYTIGYSTADVYDYGYEKLFFLRPQTLEEVTAEALGAMSLDLGGTMKTLALCGVGCLALLMALPILFKVLRRFL